MHINEYVFGALIGALLGQTALLRYWVKNRRKECAKCLEDMRMKYARPKFEAEARRLNQEVKTSIMTPPISKKIQ